MRILSLLACLALVACADAPEPQDDDLRALVDSLLPSLERTALLEAVEPVRVERRSSEQVRAFVEEQLVEEMPPERLDGIQGVYALLGLIPDTVDLRALLLDLYTEQIVGYYDPETKTLYAVEQVSRDALRPVIAHELVHALQDQHADLDSLISIERGNDRQVAAQAALEGHATLVMLAVLAAEATGKPVDPATLPAAAEQLRAGLEGSNEQFPVFRRAPRALREMLFFPYAEGAAFVQSVWSARPPEARTAPIGDELPQSTEQVMWPAEAFIETRDPPTELRFMGETPWRVVYENTLGALETRLFLEEHLGDGTAARGWDGDRYRLLESGDGTRALVWVSIWDDATAANRFADAVRRILAGGRVPASGAVTTATVENRPIVRVVLAGSDQPVTQVPLLEIHCADVSGARVPCATGNGR